MHIAKKILLGIFICSGIALSFIQDARCQETTFNLRTRYLLQADLDNRSGEIDITETVTHLQVDDKVAGKLPVTFSAKIKYLTIDESVTLDVPNSLIGRQFSLGTKFPVPYVDWNNCYIGIDLMPALYTDDWDWADSAFRLPFRAYFIHRPNEQLTLVAGALVRIDYDQEIWPILGLIYKPDDRLTINLASNEPNIRYRLTDRLTLIGEFDLTSDEYEVTRNNDNNVVLTYRQFGTGLGAEYTLDENISAVMTLGRVFARKMEYLDTGEELYPEASFYINGKISWQY